MTVAVLEKLFAADSVGPIHWSQLCEDTRINVVKLARREQVPLKELAGFLHTKPGTISSFMDAHGLQIGDSFTVRLAGGDAVRALRKRGKIEDNGFAGRVAFMTNEQAQREAIERNLHILEHFEGDKDGEGQMVALVDLCDHHCRWPFDTAAGTRFCGLYAPPGQSYCDAHKAKSTRTIEVSDG
jgi:hypothetical protein